MKTILYLSVVLLGLGACKKEYTCECKNSYSTYSAGTTTADNKQQAKKYCKNLSSGDTECYLK